VDADVLQHGDKLAALERVVRRKRNKVLQLRKDLSGHGAGLRSVCTSLASLHHVEEPMFITGGVSVVHLQDRQKYFEKMVAKTKQDLDCAEQSYCESAVHLEQAAARLAAAELASSNMMRATSEPTLSSAVTSRGKTTPCTASSLDGPSGSHRGERFDFPSSLPGGKPEWQDVGTGMGVPPKQRDVTLRSNKPSGPLAPPGDSRPSGARAKLPVVAGRDAGRTAPQPREYNTPVPGSGPELAHPLPNSPPEPSHQPTRPRRGSRQHGGRVTAKTPSESQIALQHVESMSRIKETSHSIAEDLSALCSSLMRKLDEDPPPCANQPEVTPEDTVSASCSQGAQEPMTATCENVKQRRGSRESKDELSVKTTPVLRHHRRMTRTAWYQQGREAPELDLLHLRQLPLKDAIRGAVLIRAEGNIQNACAVFDVNGNGVVSITEFEMGLQQLKIPYQQFSGFTTVKNLFRALDVDGSGTIELAEFFELEDLEFMEKDLANMSTQEMWMDWCSRTAKPIPNTRKARWTGWSIDQLEDLDKRKREHKQRRQDTKSLFQLGHRDPAVLCRHLPGDGRDNQLVRRTWLDTVTSSSKRTRRCIADLGGARRELGALNASLLELGEEARKQDEERQRVEMQEMRRRQMGAFADGLANSCSGPNADEMVTMWSSYHNDLPEAEKELRRIAKELEIPLADAETIKKEFDMYDQDGSGSIEKHEFLQVLSGLLQVEPEEIPPGRVSDYWKELDTDGQHSVDFQKFLEWYYFTLGVPKNKMRRSKRVPDHKPRTSKEKSSWAGQVR